MTGTERRAPAITVAPVSPVRLLGPALLRGIAAGAAAVLTMAVICGIGLAATGAADLGALVPLIAAAVALASGGRVDFILAVNGRGASALGGLTGGLELMPLGATLAGALVLAVVVLRPPTKQPRSLSVPAVRAVGALAGYLSLLAVAASTGHGTLTRAAGGTPTPAPSTSGGGIFDNNGLPAGENPRLNPGGTGTGGGARDLGDLISDGRVLHYNTVAGATLLHGLLVVLLILALCWVAGRSAPAPAWVRSVLRPAVSATATVILAISAVGVVAGALVAPFRPNGWPALGALVLGWPNAFFIGWESGLNVPWTIDAAGVFGNRQLAGVGAANGGQQWPRPLLDPSAMDGKAAALLVTAAALIALACGVLTVVRFRKSAPPSLTAAPMLRQAAVPAIALGGVLAVVLPLGGLAANASGGIGLHILGFSVATVSLEVSGGLWQAALSGLLGGAAAGLLGAFLVAAFTRRRQRAAL